MIQCRFENGNNASLRHVTVSSVVLNKEKTKVLLAKRAAHLPNPGKWCLPGGYLDRDEKTAQGACREVYEETGFTVKPVTLLRIIDDPERPKEDKQNVEFAYVVEMKDKDKAIDEETTEVRWFDLDSVPDIKEWAYDHFETFAWYKRWLKEGFALPVFNETIG